MSNQGMAVCTVRCVMISFSTPHWKTLGCESRDADYLVSTTSANVGTGHSNVLC